VGGEARLLVGWGGDFGEVNWSESSISTIVSTKKPSLSKEKAEDTKEPEGEGGKVLRQC